MPKLQSSIVERINYSALNENNEFVYIISYAERRPQNPITVHTLSLMCLYSFTVWSFQNRALMNAKLLSTFVT